MRKHARDVYSFRLIGLYMGSHIQKLLNKNKDQEIQYFIKSCQELKKETLKFSNENKIIISSELICNLEQQQIHDLYDCENFRKLLINVYEELSKQSKTLFLFYPLLLPYLPIPFIEILLLSIILLGSMIFGPFFLNSLKL